MRTQPITLDDLCGVFAVPPLARQRDRRRTIDQAQNSRLVNHIVDGGITRLLWGGNAFLYHVTLADYETLLNWMATLPERVWAIPSIGPSFGRAMDQVPILRAHGFPTAMWGKSRHEARGSGTVADKRRYTRISNKNPEFRVRPRQSVTDR